MNKTTAALVSIASVGGAALIGAQFGPQRPREAIWYETLRKPSYTPSGSTIGFAWGILETLLAVTGYRLLTRPNSAARGTALASWGATLAGLTGYPALFFGGKKLGPSAAVATAMCASTTATAAAASKVDEVAAVSMTPLVLWTMFAVVLSEEVWRRNQPRRSRGRVPGTTATQPGALADVVAP
ncbi:MAG: TspO/MBR family protein [Rhodopila sp.]